MSEKKIVTNQVSSSTITKQETVTEAPVVKRNVEEELRKQWEIDKKPVKGMFKFHECPGALMSFVYRKYKWDQVERYDFIDGQLYTIPLGVAKHLNKNCWYPIDKHIQGADGKHSVVLGQKVRRVSFQSLEFTDMDDLQPTPDLVTVQSTYY
jgi:hypothetical protein